MSDHRSHSPRPSPRVDSRGLERLEALIQDPAAKVEDLVAAAEHQSLPEDLALALLKRRDLARPVLEALAKNSKVLKSRKVRLEVVIHPRTPRHFTLPAIRQLYTFDLMQVTVTPQTPADVRIAAEEMLIKRMESVSLGERLTLAKRGSGAIAAALLLDEDLRVSTAALNNSRLTEMHLIQSLLPKGRDPSKQLAQDVCRHAKWSLRVDVRAALLRHPHTPLGHAISFSQSFTVRELRDVFEQSELPENTRYYLLVLAEKRRKGK